MPGTGYFEIVEGGAVKANGKIIAVDATDSNTESLPAGDSEPSELHLDINTQDIYKEFRLRGYSYGPSFQGILGANLESKTGFFSSLLCSKNS